MVGYQLDSREYSCLALRPYRSSTGRIGGRMHFRFEGKDVPTLTLFNTEFLVDI